VVAPDDLSQITPSIEEFSKELQKLSQQLAKFRPGGWAQILVPFVPMITALIAVAGFVFSIVQYTALQREERQAKGAEQKIRDDNEIRADLDQLLTLATDKSIATAKASLLLEDLHTLANRRPEEEARARITDVLVQYILWDCNLDNPRDVQLDLALMNHWTDYELYLVRNPSKADSLMYKYFQALRHLHAEAPKYFETMHYIKGSGYEVEGYTEEARYARFVALVEAFARHLAWMEKYPDNRKAAISRFSEALNNSALAEELFSSRAASDDSPP